ncbi:MAG: trypsin-like serine protease [Oligoflexales bacterium]
MKSILLSCYVVVIWGVSCKSNTVSGTKLVDATVVDGNMSEELGGTVMLYLNDSPCTAQHIGGGYLLTAAHCVIIGGKGDRPSLRIRHAGGFYLMSLEPHEYEEIRPAATETSEMTAGNRTFKIPIPDLSIIRPKAEDNIAMLSALRKYDLTVNILNEQQEGVFIAGYGRTSYDNSSPIDGNLRVGPAVVSNVEANTYQIFWRQGDGLTGATSGDSGGPLFTNADDKLLLYGVASNIIRKKNDSGSTELVWAQYTRLDTFPVRDWIKEKTGIIY